MRLQELVVKIDVNPSVSDDAAGRCLQLLEWYMNDHKELDILVETDEAGCQRFSFRRKPWLDKEAHNNGKIC